MARTLDEIFSGTGSVSSGGKALNEIFSPENIQRTIPKPTDYSKALKELSLYYDTAKQMLPKQSPVTTYNSKSSLNPFEKYIKGAVDNSILGRVAYKAGTALRTGNFSEPLPLFPNYQAKTLGNKAINFVSGNLTDAPLWYVGDAAAAKLLTPIGKTALATKALSKIPEVIKPALGTGLKAGITWSGGIAPLSSVVTGQNLAKLEKETPLMMAGGAALHGAGQLLGKGIDKASEAILTKKLSNEFKPLKVNPLEEVQKAYKTPTLRDVKQAEYERLFSGPNTLYRPELRPVNPSQYFTKTQTGLEAAFPPREINKYSFTTGEQRALSELQEGIQTAQNYVKHNDVLAAYPPGTTIEQAYADIKVNTGVDIPKLTENLLKAQQATTKLTPEKLKIGRAAGVIPELKARESLPKAEEPIRTIPETPERRIWTNKDNFPVGGNNIPTRRLTNSEIPKYKTASANKEFPNNESYDIEIPIGKNGELNFANTISKPSNAVLKESKPLNKTIADAKIESPSVAPELSDDINFDPTKIKDIGHFKAYANDAYRIMRDAFGKDAGDEFMKPFDTAKSENINMQEDLTSRLKKYIVDELGIKKGSKESALVQKYGEGLINLEQLKKIAPKKWENIIGANEWFRNEYDKLIEQVNTSKALIYPNAQSRMANIEVEIEIAKSNKNLSATERKELLEELEAKYENAMRGKFVPKRSNYYRHFREFAEGIQGFKNIFDSPANISTNLIGVSDFTKPKSKWASFMQKRIDGRAATYDAVGGFLDYIPAASYTTHIDPQIARIRDFTQAIREATADSHNADTFIGFLDKFANDLAGKTNPVDRVIQDMIPGGRKTFVALTWLNNRIKANVILGKASSILAQTANIPNGIAFAKQYSIPGLLRTVTSFKNPEAVMRQSPFLRERFGDQMYRQFDTKLLDKPKDMLVWMMETADKVGNSFIWNSAYEKGLTQKATDPIRYADMATRDLVAGRGIGEVPLLQKSKLFQLIAPFQLEVANLWHIQKDFIKAKDFGGLIALYMLNYGFNEIMKRTRGSNVVFDPIGASIEAMREKDTTPLQKAGRLAGEIMSNMPVGQTLASLYPEYGTETLPSRKELFGSNDPTRYGSSVLIAKGIQDPVSKLLPPFAGEQIKKTIQGLQSLKKGGQYNSSGNLLYPIRPTTSNNLKALLFGPSATSEAQEYYNLKRKPLTEKQTNQVINSLNPFETYNRIQEKRRLDSLKLKENK